MSKRKIRAIVLMSGILILIAATGCQEGDRVGETIEESQTVELGDEESVDVEIAMGAGELEVTGGSAELLEADFTYNVEELDPEATFSSGILVISHADIEEGIGTILDLDDYRNEWDLQLNDDVSMEMRINLGAGKSDLTLGSLALTRLDMNSGAGEVLVDLSNSQTLSRFDFDMGAGEVTLDFTGDWSDDLDALIRGGVGDLTLQLPQDVGVIVEVQTGIGTVNASGLNKDGDSYTNNAYGESEVTLRIEVDAGVGQINLEEGS